MRVKLALAIILSIVLIGFASWSRLFGHQNPTNIALESTPGGADNFSGLLQAYLDKTASSTNAGSTTSDKPLTGTDLLSRELIIDYVNLATSGEATQENLDALAQKYVDIIPTLEASATVKTTDLKLVSNTKNNLIAYSETLVGIENSYRKTVTSTYTNTPDSINLGVGLYAVTGKVALIYDDTAKKLTDISVPRVLAEQHVRLINYYLNNALSMRSISDADTDPVTAFAGLVKLNTSVDEEDAILSSIDTILKANDL